MRRPLTLIRRPDPSGNPTSNPVAWIHAAEMAGAAAVAGLARQIAFDRPEATVLITGAEMPEAAEQICRVAAPGERRSEVRRFLDEWRPAVALFTTFDLSAPLVQETADRGIPLYLADARQARPQPRRWAPNRSALAQNLARFDRVLIGDADGRDLMLRLGVERDRIDVVGQLEEGASALPCNENDREALAAAVAGRPVWLAAGISRDETGAVAGAHRRALGRAHRLLLILTLADPGQGPDVAEELAAGGWSVALRSEHDEPHPGTQIYIADTEGEAGLWYRLAPVTFLGRSLFAGPGQSPLDAAALGSAILHGPHFGEHQSTYARLDAAAATRLVRSEEELGRAVEMLLSPASTALMAQAAWRVTSEGAEAADRVIRLITAALDAADS